VDAATAARFADVWEFPVPAAPGWTTTEMIAASSRGEVDLFWIVGGNFLETLPDADTCRRALQRPRLRVHQDIVLSSSMLVDGDGDVLLLPATTRYESPGGGTETSTERRIIFSPEIPGRRIGSAKPEWWVFGETMARAFPSRANFIRFDGADDIRREIARAVPLYNGIETLHAKGDQVQWGGPTLFADGRFATSDGKAHFSPVSLAVRGIRPPPSTPLGPGPRSRSGQALEETQGRQPDHSPTRHVFYVSTRRGKQFNSMVQRPIDPLTGAGRDAVLISAEDLARLELAEGSAVQLISACGVFTGTLKIAPMKPGNLEVHWPEGMRLLSASAIDPESMEPDYNAVVTIDEVK
jgi:predicted molibdopterin-dependent oxidoreductase YjgC